MLCGPSFVNSTKVAILAPTHNGSDAARSTSIFLTGSKKSRKHYSLQKPEIAVQLH